MIKRIVCSIAFVTSLARIAPAQQDSLLLPADRDASAELTRIVSAARDAGLPVDPILGKVGYGVMVHAPPQRIVAAARALAARLQVARDALAPRPTASDIATGADALEYGATKDDLRAVRTASGDQSVSTPLGVLAQLVASGVPAKRAAAIVTDLIKRHASAAQLVALGTNVNADVAGGAQAVAALDTRLRGLTAVLAWRDGHDHRPKHQLVDSEEEAVASVYKQLLCGMRRVGLILLLICLATRLPAQWQASADAGATHLRQTGIPESNAVTVGAGVDALGERTLLRSRLLFSRGANAQATGQGVVLGSVVGPYATGPNWELFGALSGFRETNATLTTSAEGMARLRFGGTALGGAIGAGGGTLSDRVDRRGLYRAQATAWRTFSADQLMIDGSFVGTSASLVESTRYADVSTSWRRDHRGLELGATAGVRAGFSSATTSGWGSLDAVAWIAPNLALVAAAGRSLEDVPRGVPSTQYASIALRIAARSHAAVFEARAPLVTAKTIVTRGGVAVRIDGAARVELMADFTDWSVIELARSGDAWSFDRAVSPGLHRMAIRVDGGEWTAPPGLPRATDDLGGVVGLITVP